MSDRGHTIWGQVAAVFIVLAAGVSCTVSANYRAVEVERAKASAAVATARQHEETAR